MIEFAGENRQYPNENGCCVVLPGERDISAA